MVVNRKSQYALRAVLELTLRYGQGPSKIAEIAEAQKIPRRFLEVILSQLRQAGLVDSYRGTEGGYTLARSPSDVTVRDVILVTQGPIQSVDHDPNPTNGDTVFLPIWEKVQEAVTQIYGSVSFEQLAELKRQQDRKFVPGYTI